MARKLLVSDEPNNFNLIRIAMALLVVWSHSFALYFGSEANEPISRLMGGVFNAGNLAVYVFFIVSGFLITQSFERSKSRWSYLKKRIGRIYPGYLAAIAICAFLILPWWTNVAYTPAGLVKTIGLNLLLQHYFIEPRPFAHNPIPGLNGSLWSIPFEFWCYLGVLAMGTAGLLKMGRRPLLVSAILLVISLHVRAELTGKIPGGHLSFIIGWPHEWLRVFPCFMAGALIYLYRRELPRSGLAVALGIALMIVTAHLPLSIHVRTACNAVLFPPVIGYTTCYLGFSRQVGEAARYGDFSYGTYLYAFPIQQLLKASAVLSFGAFVTASMACSLTAGIASWYAVERWFLPTKRNRADDKRLGAPLSGRIRSWLDRIFGASELDRLCLVLESKRDLLAAEDRQFLHLMRERLKCALPLHTAHEERLRGMYEEIQQKMAW